MVVVAMGVARGAEAFLDWVTARNQARARRRKAAVVFLPQSPPHLRNNSSQTRKTNHLAKEQQAVTLINQCKPQEAEATYRALITAGTTNHTAYGHLAAT
jgi:hypothetical protein